MLALLDETYPELPAGVAYVLAAVMFAADEVDARAALAGVLRDRIRPFHWHREGPRARCALAESMISVGAVAFAYVQYPTPKTRLESARARVLRELLPDLLAEGMDRLVIESRGAVADARDQATILDFLNRAGRYVTLAYEWRTKTEPLLWAADAVCGAVRQHLIQPGDAPHFQRLSVSGALDRVIYLGPPNA